MPVSDFECQIARGQIGRYLDGGALSPAALTSLEDHLAECPGCKAVVAERRAALLVEIERPTRAVVEMPVENAFVAALRARVAQEEKEADVRSEPAKPEPAKKAAPRYAKSGAAKGDLTKPLALAALLAAVLLGMGRLSRTATAPAAHASAAFAAESLPSKTASTGHPAPVVKGPVKAAAPKPKPALPKLVASRPKPSMGDLFVPSAGPDSRESAPAPKVRLAKPTAVKPRAVKPRPVLKAAQPRPARRPRSLSRRAWAHRKGAPWTTVRVYGLDGRPLKP